METTKSCFGEGTSEVLKKPYFPSVLAKTVEASSGRSIFHFRAKTLMILNVRLAHSQSSAISSRFFTP